MGRIWSSGLGQTGFPWTGTFGEGYRLEDILTPVQTVGRHDWSYHKQSRQSHRGFSGERRAFSLR